MDWRTPLPLAEAAAFFLRVKGIAPEDAALAKIALAVAANPMAEGAYLENEQAAAQAEEQNASVFYKQKMQEALQELASHQEQSAERSSHLEDLQSRLEQQDGLRQEYQRMVADATERAVAAQDEVLQEQQAAAALRMAYQQLRGQLLQVAAQEPPTTQGLADMAPAAAGPQPAQAEAGLSPTTSPASLPTGAPADTASSPPASGPADAAPSPPAAPNSPNPQGDGDVHERSAPSAGGAPKGTTHVSIKQAAGPGGLAAKLPLVAAGAGLGGALELWSARRGNNALRDKVRSLEGRGQERSLGEALDLAQAKARLAFGEFQETHPRAATLAGMGVGALTGATSGSGIVDDIRRAADALRRARQMG